ncbi:MAG: class I lanthipeptide [Flavobacteriaceae bacterium]|jgi:natural product precursor|nr:class I lanthipeptide [Flavobacteriaceae bacterium]
MQKLTLKKEKIKELSLSQMNQVVGGGEEDRAAGTAKSSYHGFTCCWCTNIDTTTPKSASGGCTITAP